MLTVTILGCNMYKYIVALVLKAHAWEQFLSSHLKLCTKKNPFLVTSHFVVPPLLVPRHVWFILISALSRKVSVSVVSRPQTRSESNRCSLLPSRLHLCIAAVIALASLSSSCGRKRINRPELSALHQFFSLPARHECETRRAGRDRSAGSSGRWEVTGERSRCTAEWRRDVNPGTSMTYDCGVRGKEAEKLNSRDKAVVICSLQSNNKTLIVFPTLLFVLVPFSLSALFQYSCQPSLR